MDRLASTAQETPPEITATCAKSARDTQGLVCVLVCVCVCLGAPCPCTHVETNSNSTLIPMRRSGLRRFTSLARKHEHHSATRTHAARHPHRPDPDAHCARVAAVSSVQRRGGKKKGGRKRQGPGSAGPTQCATRDEYARAPRPWRRRAHSLRRERAGARRTGTAWPPQPLILRRACSMDPSMPGLLSMRHTSHARSIEWWAGATPHARKSRARGEGHR